MRIAQGRAVPLGYGKYVRSDRIAALQPIDEARGPGRRTWVWVDGVEEPFVASRSEAAILSDMVEGRQDAGRSDRQRTLLQDLLDAVDDVDPVLRRIVRDQAGWDLDRLEKRIREVLGIEGGGG